MAVELLIELVEHEFDHFVLDRGPFGIGGTHEATQKEVADLLGISQSYISRLEKRIIAHLRQEMLRQMQC